MLDLFDLFPNEDNENPDPCEAGEFDKSKAVDDKFVTEEVADLSRKE